MTEETSFVCHGVDSHRTYLSWVQRCQTGWGRCWRASKVTWSSAWCRSLWMFWEM